MEAARVASLRGHNVSLYAKEKRLGGLLPTAALVKGLEIEDLEAIVKYFETQHAKQGVTVKLGKEVDLSVIEEAKPDVVVLAAGGVLTLPDVTGIERRNGAGGPELYRKEKFYQRFFRPRTLSRLAIFLLPLWKHLIIIC